MKSQWWNNPRCVQVYFLVDVDFFMVVVLILRWHFSFYTFACDFCPSTHTHIFGVYLLWFPRLALDTCQRWTKFEKLFHIKNHFPITRIPVVDKNMNIFRIYIYIYMSPNLRAHFSSKWTYPHSTCLDTKIPPNNSKMCPRCHHNL